MKRSVVGWIIAAIVAVGGAAFAYLFYFAGGSGEPSTDLTTPEVIGTTTTATAESGLDEATTSTDSPSTTTSESTGASAFVIDSEQSIASFVIDEVLRGEPTTIVGTTDQVAGQIVVDSENLGASQFSEIVINARTFTTDSDRRNRAIRGPVILNSASDEHELITFLPASVDGLAGLTASPGETYEFSLTGELTIRDTTNPVTFNVTAGLVDETTIEGSATSEVSRSDFGIGIPSVGFVADVTDEVTLQLDFVARVP